MCPKRFVMKKWNLVINNVDWWCILICSLTPSIRLSGCPLGKLASLQDWINHCSSWMCLRCASRGAEGKSKRKNVGQHGGSIRTALSGCAFSCQGSHSGGNAFANPCRGGLPFLKMQFDLWACKWSMDPWVSKDEKNQLLTCQIVSATIFLWLSTYIYIYIHI